MRPGANANSVQVIARSTRTGVLAAAVNCLSWIPLVHVYFA